MRGPIFVTVAAAAMAATLARPAAADYAGGVQAWVHGDYAAAANAFLGPARLGDAESQYMLGRLYALGDGVPQDFVQSWLWFDRAARQGHAPAAQARDALGAILNTAQKAQVAAAVPVSPPAPPAPPAPVASTLASTPASMAAAAPEAERVGTLVLVPRRGVVPRSPPAGSPDRASLSAPAATEEGRLLAEAGADQVVRSLQRALAQAGFDPGPVDGEMGSFTRRAIRAYQSAHGLPPDGVLSGVLLRRLGVAELQQAAR